MIFFFLGALGMAWADVTWLERWRGLDGFVKLLAIPMLMAQCRQSDNGRQVFIGFLISCALLLIASWITAIWPEFPRGSESAGVAVKSYIVQSGEFLICSTALIFLCVERARKYQWVQSATCLLLAVGFLTDILFIASSRTTLLTIPILLFLYVGRRFSLRGLFAVLGVSIILAAAVWATSPYLRERVSSIYLQAESFKKELPFSSGAERIVFWTESIQFIRAAPLIGHGTGSIPKLFRAAAAGKTGVWAEASTNPHNQTFAVAIQLGLLGAVVLWAMWAAHFLVFGGDDFAAWFGASIVTLYVVGSLFNSFLFDFTEGWLYVIGIGVTVGTVRRRLDAQHSDGLTAAVMKA